MNFYSQLKVLGFVAGLGFSPVLAQAQTVGDANRLEVLRTYQQTKVSEALRGAIDTLPLTERQGLTEVLQGIYFIDYKYTARELMQGFLGEKKYSEMKFPRKYDAQDNSFDKFNLGRNLIANHRGPVTLELLREIHKVAIGVDLNGAHGSKETAPGEIRQRLVFGPEYEVGLTRATIDAINASPYLFYVPGTSIYADVPKGSINDAVKGDKITGAIFYPRPRDIKPEALAFIKNSNPQLVQRILEYQEESRKLLQGIWRPNRSWENRDPQLTQDLVTALITERIQRFERDLVQLGEVRTPAKIQAYIRMISQFQKDYISIHPFPDGNGRTSRLVLMYLAARKGLPVPRIVNPNDDVYSTVDQWSTQIRDGMVATAQLEYDLLRRINQGLPLERSVEMLSPILAQDRGALASMAATYQEYIFQRFSREQSVLGPRYAADPIATMRMVLRQYGQQGQPNLDEVPLDQASGN